MCKILGCDNIINFVSDLTVHRVKSKFLLFYQVSKLLLSLVPGQFFLGPIRRGNEASYYVAKMSQKKEPLSLRGPKMAQNYSFVCASLFSL